MSRIGEQPIPVPAGVEVVVSGRRVEVKGPKGELALEAHPAMKVVHDEEAKAIRVTRPTDSDDHRALHGLTRTLVANMVEGVTKGFEKRLEIVGVGYNARAQGAKLLLNVGYSQPVEMPVPEGLEVQTPQPTRIVITGADKQRVGQFAAEVRKVRPPEPYKGKGIRYDGEFVRRKAGKTFAAGTA
jgi:large subunit ribosomal protein L6